ncbi:MAG: HAD family hydrolase [bacterium]|jgi:FMN phosphatase YigB (HAD superfamily)
MYKTLLFDLDGTLLNLDIDRFLPIYFRALTTRFAHLMAPAEFIFHLMASTEAMINNKDQRLTNEEAFMLDFVPRISISREELMPILEDFYRHDFAKLADDTFFLPLAQKTVKNALEKGFEVVIATNPVFPRLAMEHRLHWAGLKDCPFRLVTTYENMHFCKPHIEYYKEILTLIGREPAECLMIGNDVQEDLVAGQIGIKTFLVKDCLINRLPKDPVADYQGYLADLYRFIREL